jgi:hypothetical protein
MTFFIALVTVVLGVYVPSSNAAVDWYAGVWDATIYNRIEHPKTVAIRIEFRDSETGDAVSNVNVSLRGTYLEERIGTAGNEVGIPHENQEREYTLGARTDERGIAVFALSWQKDYPWLFDFPKKTDSKGNMVTYDIHTSWNRALDDIEKVQLIEVQKAGYRKRIISFDFKHLTEAGQNPKSELQDQSVVKRFEEAWHAEVTQTGVRLCVLDLGTQFPDFQNTRSSRPEFFKLIRDKRLGTVYSSPKNFFSVGKPPQSECGPYLVYLLEVELERLTNQIEVVVKTSRNDNLIDEQEQDPSSRIPIRKSDRDRKKEKDVIVQDTQVELVERQYPKADLVVSPSNDTRAHKVQKNLTVEAPQLKSLGAAVTTLSENQRQRLGLYIGVSGALVCSVEPDSPASRAGLEAGMVIWSVEQKSIKSAEDYLNLTSGKQHGDQISIGVWQKSGKWLRSEKRVSF